MNIVRISAGLGNQMFQYAFFRALQTKHPETKMDISEFKYRKHHYGYELEKLFAIIPTYADRKECDAMADLSKDIFSEFRRKILKIKRKTKAEFIDEGKLTYMFHPELLEKENAYFQGFWQTEKYFASVQDKIRQELSFKIALDEKNQSIADEIAAVNAVSIHVRRGDYIKERRYQNIGSVCSDKYYQSAIEHMQSKLKEVKYYVFSDDIDWVKSNLRLKNARYIAHNTAENSFRDMQLMSLCKHNIIANSSFSWWGAWLNSNPSKIVIAPNIWFRDTEMPDIVPESWIRIKVD